MPYAAIDLFCGVGGLTKGLEQSGINVVAGIDFEPSCQYAYEENNNAKFILTKILYLHQKDSLPNAGTSLLNTALIALYFSYSLSSKLLIFLYWYHTKFGEK